MASANKPPAPHNPSTSLQNLPVEIASGIIRDAILDADGLRAQFRNLLNISLVDSTFQQAILETPAVWTNICIDYDTRSLDLALLCVDRSQNCHLDLQICCTRTRPFKTAVGILAKNSDRVKSLVLFPEGTEQRDIFHEMSPIHVPVLRYFHLRDFFSKCPAIPVAPQLKELFLTCGGLPTGPAISFRALISLRLDSVRYRDLHFTSLLSVLDMAPRLHLLWVEECGFTWSLSETHNMVTCPSVTRIVIKRMPYEFFPYLLAHLELPELERAHHDLCMLEENGDVWRMQRVGTFPALTTLCVQVWCPYQPRRGIAQVLSEMVVGFSSNFPNTKQLVMLFGADILLKELAGVTRSAERPPFPELEKLLLGEIIAVDRRETLEAADDFVTARKERGMSHVRLQLKDTLTTEETCTESTVVGQAPEVIPVEHHVFKPRDDTHPQPPSHLSLPSLPPSTRTEGTITAHLYTMAAVDNLPAPNNTPIAIQELPVEIISEILQAYILSAKGPSSLFDRISTTSLINSTFRRIVLDTPKLWSTIHINGHENSLRLAELCLSRSRACDLIIEVDCGSSDTIIQKAMDVVLANAHRIQALDLETTTDHQAEMIHVISDLSIPKLRRLEFAKRSAAVSPTRIALASTTQLQVLSFLNALPPVTLHPLNALKSLGFGGDFTVSPDPEYLESIWSILEMAPMLETIWIDSIQVAWPSGKYSKRIKCPNVRHLVVKNSSFGALLNFLASLELPKLEKIKYGPATWKTNNDDPASWALQTDEVFSRVTTLCLETQSAQQPSSAVFSVEETAMTLAVKFPNTKHILVQGDAGQMLNGWASQTRRVAKGVAFVELEKMTLVNLGDDWTDLPDVYNFVTARKERGLKRVDLRVKPRLTPEDDTELKWYW